MTIKGKLVALGIVALLAIAVLSGIAIWSATSGKAATEQNIERQTQLNDAQTMRVAALQTMLAAMDSIIDKEDGKIAPERMKIIDTSIAALRKGKEALLKAADTDEEKKLAAAMGKKIDGLANGVQVDLVKLIETKAPEDAFVKIDDVLDEFGVVLIEDLATFIASVANEAAEASEAAIDNNQHAVGLSIGAMIVSLLVIAAGLVLIGRSIINPISGMTGAMGRLAGGDTSTEIPGLGGRDEIADMAKAVEIFKSNMVENLRLAAEKEAEQQASSQRAARRDSGIAGFDRDVTGLLQTVTAAISQTRSIADRLAHTADNATARSSTVAAASEQASANVQTVATAAEELSSSIGEISRQVAQSAEVSSTAVQEAERTNIQVQGLADAANKIGEVVSLISDIAEQTNLLALNATIEAARAGKAGKGFAVVASEVKNLANQTARATEEISAQIGDIQTATQQAVGAIGGISATIGQINEIASAIAAAVEEQGAATGEIARNVQQAAVGTQDVSDNIGAVSTAAGETRSAASEAVSAADSLTRDAESLRARVDGFLAEMRAA